MNIYIVMIVSAVLALCAVLIKQMRFEIGVLFSAFLAISLLFFAVEKAAPIFSYLGKLSESTGYLEYLPYIMKAMAIGLVSEISSDICRDCGEVSSASKVELIGKIAILAVCMPLVMKIAQTAQFFFK